MRKVLRLCGTGRIGSRGDRTNRAPAPLSARSRPGVSQIHSSPPPPPASRKQRCVRMWEEDCEPGQRLPDMAATLKHFAEGFNHNHAKKNGTIVPVRAGLVPAYDDALAAKAAAKAALDAHLRELQAEWGTKDVKWFNRNKDRYMIEIPEADDDA